MIPDSLGLYAPLAPDLPEDVWAILRRLVDRHSARDLRQALEYLFEEQRQQQRLSPRH
jgi:hypothetical protein